VAVFTTNVDGSGISDVALNQVTELDGVRVHYFPSTLRRIYYSPAMRRALHKGVRNYDIVHTHSVFLWPTAAAARAAFAQGVPYVVSPRGMLVPELIAMKSRMAKRMWIAFIEKRNLARACAVHVTSEQELEALRRVVDFPRAAMVPNGVDIPQTQVSQRDPAMVLFLGRINWKKGLDRLIEAIAATGNARLIVAGQDDENYLATLPTHDRVTFVGEVAGEKKEQLLASAAVLVLPSISENFGNVVLEAMAHSTPVIVTPGVGLAAAVEQSGAGLVCDGAPAALTAAIERLLADQNLRLEMGKRGRSLAETHFGWDRIAIEMETLYESCSSRSRR
jgi:glycosyltransferase involved in cell wall biosynthesis